VKYQRIQKMTLRYWKSTWSSIEVTIDLFKKILLGKRIIGSKDSEREVKSGNTSSKHSAEANINE
jgi:hypothetical protein